MVLLSASKNLEIGADLTTRINSVFSVMGRAPRDADLRFDPYLAQLAAELEKNGDTFSETFEEWRRDNLRTEIVQIPSLSQALWAAEVARSGFKEGGLVNPSICGSGKTFGAFAAIPLINRILQEEMGHPNRKVRTLYAGPSTLIPKMQEQARFLLGDDLVLVPITQERREEDIKRAREENADIVYVGYEMSFRNYRANYTDQANARQSLEDFFRVRAEFPTIDAAHEEIERLVGRRKAQQLKKKNANLTDLAAEIVKARANRDAISVMEALTEQVFPNDGLYYSIFDEVHHLVSGDSKTAQALGNFFRNSRWSLAMTGTMIGNYISNDAFLAYLVGMVDNPKHYKRLVGNDPSRVKMFFKPYTVSPVITDVKQVDPLVPDAREKTIFYRPSDALVKLHIELEDAECFRGVERVLLSHYFLTNPEKVKSLLEESDGKELKGLAKFFEDEKRLSLLEEIIEHGSERVAAVARMLDELEPHEKALIFVEYTNHTMDFLKRELAKRGHDFVVVDQNVPTRTNGSGTSARMSLWNAAQYNPDVKGAISSPRICGEGLDGQRYTHIIYYGLPTVPFRVTQGNSRAHRRLQRDVVSIHHLEAIDILTDALRRDVCKYKGSFSERFYDGREPTPEEIKEALKDVSEKRMEKLAQLRAIDTRGHLGIFFNSHVGIGSKNFSKALSRGSNHLFMAERFNRRYETSHSANVGRLLNNIIHSQVHTEKETLDGVESLIAREIKEVADLGSGPAAYSRATGRKSICVDLSGKQLDFGDLATEHIKGMELYLGSMQDLSNLVPLLDSEDDVFNPIQDYDNKTGLAEHSLDLIVCSNAVYFLDMEERPQFFKDIKQYLREDEDSYLVMAIPRSKISAECEERFLADIELAGFEINYALSGQYNASQAYNVENDETTNRTSFESVVIIAKNNPENSPNFAEEREYFKLQPEYEVRNGSILELDLQKAEKDSQASRLIYDGFYRAKSLASTDTEFAEEYSAASNTVSENSVPEQLRRIREAGLEGDFSDALAAFMRVIESSGEQ